MDVVNLADCFVSFESLARARDENYMYSVRYCCTGFFETKRGKMKEKVREREILYRYVTVLSEETSLFCGKEKSVIIYNTHTHVNIYIYQFFA